MRIESTHLGGVRVLVPEVREHAHGFQIEAWCSDRFRALGLPARFEQEQHTGCVRGAISSLRFHWDPPMSALLRVIRGTAFVAVVDIRPDSPGAGRWFAARVSADNCRQVWVPPGFAHGTCALSDYAEIQLKLTRRPHPGGEAAIRWDDPDIGIEWPVVDPTPSAADPVAPSLAEWLCRPEAEFFRHDARTRFAPGTE